MTPEHYLAFEMGIRRQAGMCAEHRADVAHRQVTLAAAGLADGPLDRAGYETACQIMDVTPLSDPLCVTLANELSARRCGMDVVTVAGLPERGSPAAELAVRRAEHIEQAAPPAPVRTCAECGQAFTWPGMVANLGLACGPDCYDAMSNRPGRQARRQGAVR